MQKEKNRDYTQILSRTHGCDGIVSNLNKMFDYFQSPDFPTKSLKNRMIIKIKIK